MMQKKVIKGALLFNRNKSEYADVLIEGGRISKIGAQLNITGNA
jgi:dihydroorotase-like cyclic amidohydrolase